MSIGFTVKFMPAPVPVSAFLAALKSLDGIPYIWGGKDPNKDGGLDCSGAVTYALKLSGGPDLTQTHNAARLYAETFHADPGTECLGMLAFYGPPNGPANHVMTLSDRDITGPFRVYGATGGNHHTISAEIAGKIGAKVQMRAKVLYRPDFMKLGQWIRLDYRK